jgi:hypothetical protein
MNLPGCEYITHKLIQRPWGPECRFTVRLSDGDEINEVISVPNMGITEEELASLILRRTEIIQKALQDAKRDREATFGQ